LSEIISPVPKVGSGRSHRKHVAAAGQLLNQHWRRNHRRLLLPFGLLVALLVGCALPYGDFVEGAALRFHPHWEYRDSMARDTCPAMLMITSSPAPDSASSVTSVWRLSCHRPFTPAF
jgi:hypothetical protein